MANELATGVAQYVQLASVLRHQIAHGALLPGQRLPTVAEQAARLGLARITVRQCYGLLAREGLITSQRGRGSFVADVPGAARPLDNPQLRAAINDPAAQGLRIEIIETLRQQTLPLDLQGAATACPHYLLVRKRHLHQDQPFCLAEIFVATDVAARFPPGAMAHHKLAWLLQRHAPTAMQLVQQSLTVAPAELALAQALGCAFASPVAQMTRRVLDRNGRVALAGHFWYRGDRFVMDTEIPFDVWASYPGVVIPQAKKWPL